METKFPSREFTITTEFGDMEVMSDPRVPPDTFYVISYDPGYPGGMEWVRITSPERTNMAADNIISESTMGAAWKPGDPEPPSDGSALRNPVVFDEYASYPPGLHMWPGPGAPVAPAPPYVPFPLDPNQLVGKKFSVNLHRGGSLEKMDRKDLEALVHRMREQRTAHRKSIRELNAIHLRDLLYAEEVDKQARLNRGESDRLKMSSTQLEKRWNRLIEREQAVREQEGEVKNLQTQLEEARQQTANSRSDRLEAENRNLKGTIRQVSDQLNNANSRINAQEDELTTLRSKITDLTARLLKINALIGGAGGDGHDTLPSD